MNAPIQMAEIARAVEFLAPYCDGDEQLFLDMLEGETDLHGIVGRIWEQVARDEETLVGIAARQASIAERKRRISDRVTASKALIGKFLRAASLAKLELPEVTFSVRDGKPKLEIIDPAAVPPEYQRAKPEPDKTKINEAFAQETSLPNWLVREPARDVVTARTK
jgi:hypothetical protein